jgi:signal transduction histidine kinase
VVELRTAPLAGRTLTEAIQSLPHELGDARDGPLAVALESTGLSRGLPPAVEIGLYHIAREALTNVVRHARASSVSVRIQRRRDGVRMRIADNGSGLDMSHTPPGRFGLIGMSERARLLGGELRIVSPSGGGTIVEVEVPLLERVANAGPAKRHAPKKTSPRSR